MKIKRPVRAKIDDRFLFGVLELDTPDERRFKVIRFFGTSKGRTRPLMMYREVLTPEALPLQEAIDLCEGLNKSELFHVFGAAEVASRMKPVMTQVEFNDALMAKAIADDKKFMR